MKRQSIYNELLKRLAEKRRFVQVLAGPRQVGKTTIIRQVLDASTMPAHYASADEPTLRDRTWLEQQWDIARLQANESRQGSLLVLDEIQKVHDWPSAVKFLWDADTHAGTNLKVVLLGSSPLLIQSGLTESLAGRFEVIPVPHWSFPEMRECRKYHNTGALSRFATRSWHARRVKQILSGSIATAGV
jgi:predicted AAA+ superfamily ATPase